MTPTLLVATWCDGLFIFHGETRHQEHAGEPVRSLAPDGRGGALALVNGHSLSRRALNGKWSTITTSEFELACAVSAGDGIYVGTDDARILHVSENRKTEQLIGFDAVAGETHGMRGQPALTAALSDHRSAFAR